MQRRYQRRGERRRSSCLFFPLPFLLFPPLLLLLLFLPFLLFLLTLCCCHVEEKTAAAAAATVTDSYRPLLGTQASCCLRVIAFCLLPQLAASSLTFDPISNGAEPGIDARFAFACTSLSPGNDSDKIEPSIAQGCKRPARVPVARVFASLVNSSTNHCSVVDPSLQRRERERERERERVQSRNRRTDVVSVRTNRFAQD